jgi:hypothetical protein
MPVHELDFLIPRQVFHQNQRKPGDVVGVTFLFQWQIMSDWSRGVTWEISPKLGAQLILKHD